MNFVSLTRGVFAVGLMLIVVAPSATVAQTLLFETQRSVARDGNKLYEQGRFLDAEAKYRRSLSEKQELPEAMFNMGDALYKQGKYDAAADYFTQFAAQNNTGRNVADNQTIAKSLHNLGNAMLQQKKLNESIDAYKRALRLNPNDNDTRHNLAYAQMLLQRQQKNQQQQNQNQQQQQSPQQQNQQQQQSPQQNQQQQTPPQAQNNKPSLSKVDAERILEALNNEEKNVQKKLIRKKAVPVVIEKDW
jgi:Ca-activated chloride channel homolog